MKMTSLKMTKTEAKAEFGYDGPSPQSTKSDNLPRYPYGTKIRLETEALDKLDCDLSAYTIGQVLEVTCKVEVVGISMNQRQGGKERDELELQITDMAINEDKAAKKAKVEGKHLNSISGPTSEMVDAD